MLVPAVLLMRLLRRFRPEALALVLEKRFPKLLGDRLITAVELSRDADLLIHEATFAEADEGLAIRSTHSTAAMAGRAAVEAVVVMDLSDHVHRREFLKGELGDLALPGVSLGHF